MISRHQKWKPHPYLAETAGSVSAEWQTALFSYSCICIHCRVERKVGVVCKNKESLITYYIARMKNCGGSAHLFCGEISPPLKSSCNPNCRFVSRRIPSTRYPHMHKFKSNLNFCLHFPVLSCRSHFIYIPYVKMQHYRVFVRLELLACVISLVYDLL